MENFKYELFMWFLGILGTVITSVILPYLVTLIKSKVKNEKLNHVISELGDTVISSVDYINQTFVDQLKKDGKFDEKAQKEALSRAIMTVLNTLTNNTKKILEKEGIDINLLIEKLIEAYINEKKG